MAKEFKRSDRIADLIQHEIAGLIRNELAASANGLVTVSAVRVSPDLSLASIFYTVIGSDENRKHAGARLDELRGEFRYQLSQSVALRRVPKLRFIFDVSVENGANLSALIDKAVAEDRRRAAAEEDRKE